LGSPTKSIFVFVVNLTTLSQYLRLYSVEQKDGKGMMTWKKCGRKRSWPNLRFYSSIRLEDLRKITKISSG
jgi:hypothetical protein